MPDRFTVLRDTQEKKDFWDFTTTSSWCAGTKDLHMKTGDYTFEGYEDLFTIERKADTSEISLNILETRFVKELERMEEIEHPFIVCEFTYQDVLNFPANSGIPKFRWEYLKVSNNMILRSIMDFQVKYKAKWILAGAGNGKRVTSCIMKRMSEIINGNAEQPKPRKHKK